MFAENRFAQHLADDDGGQADDDGAPAHVDVGEPLILGHQPAGQANQAVGDGQGQYLGEVDVDALCLGHGRVAAGGPDGAALFRAEVPVQDGDDNGGKDQADEDGLGDLTQGEDQRIVVHTDGQVCHPHDVQVDGVQGDLGENAGENRGNAQQGVEQTGDQPGGQTGQHGDEQGGGGGPAVEDQDHGDGAAGGKGAVYGQIGKVQQAEGDVDAESHKPPDQPLGDVARQGTK